MPASGALGKVFFDTNVLVYAHDKHCPKKRRRSRDCIAEVLASGRAVISTQILQEFFVAATRKLSVAPLAARDIVRSMTAFEVVSISPGLIHDAIDASIVHRFSFWDALVVSAAAEAGCESLYSEDFNEGQNILGVSVVNPFR